MCYDKIRKTFIGLSLKMVNQEQEYHDSVGKLIANLQSLEFLLRAFLATIYDTDSNGLIPGMPKNMYDLQVGDMVPINYLTNYYHLGQIIDKYNEYLKPKDVSFLIDRDSIVGLRDALAHGRVSGVSPHPPLRIIKFDKPDKQNIGQVKVVFSDTMDKEWFSSKIHFVYEAMMRVHNASTLFAPKMAH